MKTITQLQAELRAAAEHIENLSRELAQLQPSSRKKGLDFAHIQTIGKRYPIQDHCLVRMDADFQRQYLTLLTAPLLLESREPENGWLFLQRILCGAGCTLHLADLQADAAALTEQQLDAFSAAVLERGLADALMLDGMLLCLSSKGGEAVQDWLAALAELLGRTLPQIRELSELAALIVQEDQEGLRAFTQRDLAVSLSPANCHILPHLKWYAQVKDGVCYYYGDGETPLNVDNCIMKILDGQQAKGKALTRVEIRNAVMAEKAVYLNMGDCQLLIEDCTVRDIDQGTKDYCFRCIFNSSAVIRRCKFERLKACDYTVAIKCESYGKSPILFDEVHFQDIRSTTMCGAFTLSFDKCEMRAVTMDNIHGMGYWYYGNKGIATPDCYYRNCGWVANGLPDGLKEKKEA